MQASLTLQNYRCFLQPATVQLRKGFTAFVGVNNAGKSAFMRFLLELRPLLQQLINTDYTRNSLNYAQSYNGCLHVLDQQEVFSNLNYRPIELTIEITTSPEDLLGCATLKLVVTIHRNMTCDALFYIDGLNTKTLGANLIGHILSFTGHSQVNVEPLFDTLTLLTQTLYIGPFRNTINVGTKTD